MHGATIKIVNPQQAKLNNYKNTKLKLLKANTAISELINESLQFINQRMHTQFHIKHF